MPSHIALLAIIIIVKNNNLFSYGLAKYKVSKQTSSDNIDSITKNSSKKPSYIEHNTISTSSSSKTLSFLTVIDVETNLSLEKKNYIKKSSYIEHNTISTSSLSKTFFSLT
ncbi:21115_t:CDS:2, partial [Gigaspora margarita]